MKRSRLNLPHIKMQIAHLVANGHTQRGIAASFCSSQPAISRIVRLADVRKMIAKEEQVFKDTTEKILTRIRKELEKDPAFHNKLQAMLLKRIFNFKGQLR